MPSTATRIAYVLIAALIPIIIGASFTVLLAHALEHQQIAMQEGY